LSPPYLLDANAISDAMKGQPNLVGKLASKSGSVVTSVIVQGEIRYGLDVLPLGKRRTALEAKAASVLGSLAVEPVTESVALRYATIRSTLEKQGLVHGDNDLWIAATTLSLGAIRVTRDQDFRHVPGLTVEDWTI
jgi:predicted nucleic acid-binding protein